MDKQSALDQHRAIFLATINFLLQQAADRVIIDSDDTNGKYYKKMQLKAETHYRNGNLELLQRVMRNISGLSRLAEDNEYLAFMKERTGATPFSNSSPDLQWLLLLIGN